MDHPSVPEPELQGESVPISEPPLQEQNGSIYFDEEIEHETTESSPEDSIPSTTPRKSPQKPTAQPESPSPSTHHHFTSLGRQPYC
eukprot:43913-Rhodomonas_salina.1